MKRRLLVAAACGLALALAWWASYRPPVHPLWLLVVVHVGLAVAAGAVSTRPGAAPLAALCGLGIAPAALGPLQEAGFLTGVAGAAIQVVLVAAFMAAPAWRPKTSLVCAILGGALFAWGRYEQPMAEQPTAARITSHFASGHLAVFGIDGCDWKVVDPLIAQGRLPNLESLISRGQRGILRSTEPTASPVVWTTLFTGQPRELHGLTGWSRSDARFRQVPTLWDLFDAHGAESVVINVPGSWPPPPLEHGRFIAGFPIPSLGRGDRRQLLGRVLTTQDSNGPVPTTRIEDMVAHIELAVRHSKPVVANSLLDLFVREKILPVGTHRGRFEFEVAGSTVHIRGPFDGVVSLEEGSWSRWLTIQDKGLGAQLRLHALEVGEELTVYISPIFQAASSPRHAFSEGLQGMDLGPYVVEGVGWTAHRDERVAHLVDDLILDVQEQQLLVGRDLLEARTPALFVQVFTATDRLQHPFWALHEPQAFADWSPPSTMTNNPVVTAYEQADAALGELLELLPDDTLVFVISDHGAASETGKKEHGEGGHRVEGIWLAAGPGVPAMTEPLELRLVDILPTMLRCLEVPLAADLAGQPAERVCPGATSGFVETYVCGRGAEAPQTIDADQEEQLRSLGYLE